MGKRRSLINVLPTTTLRVDALNILYGPRVRAGKTRFSRCLFIFLGGLARCYREKQNLAVGRHEQSRLRLQEAEGSQQWKMLAHFQIPKQ